MYTSTSGALVAVGTLGYVLAQTVSPTPETWFTHAINGSAVSILGAALLLILWKVLPGANKTTTDSLTIVAQQHSASIKDLAATFTNTLDKIVARDEARNEAICKRIEELGKCLVELRLHCTEENTRRETVAAKGR